MTHPTNPEEVTVRRDWLEQLVKNGKAVDKHITKLSSETRIGLLATEIHMLLGYISSAENILKRKNY